MSIENPPELDEQPEPLDEQPERESAPAAPRNWLITGIVGVVALLAGVAIGYFAALFAFNRGVEAAVAEVGAMIQQMPAVAQVPPTPTPPPAVLDNVSVDDDPALGPEDAPVVSGEFSDFRCPYGTRFRDETLPSLLEEYGDQIRVVYRDFPVVGGEVAAIAAECANKQGEFWAYHDALFENFREHNSPEDYTALAGELGLDEEAFATCMESEEVRDEIIGDYNDARSYGVTGTPTFFINGVRVVGAQPIDMFRAIIEAQLAEAQ